jgi:hypothetical protein
MQIRYNEDVMGAIIAADCRGADPEEMRHLYIARNALDIALDTPVYRILELTHLERDLALGCLTYNRIDKVGWKDTSENPLLDRIFVGEVTGESFTLNGVIECVYGSCWSTAASEHGNEWLVFARREPAARLQSTPRKLLNAAMSRRDRHYMNHHYIGKMQYAAESDIEAFFADPQFDKHLDGAGHGLAASFLQLSNDLASEQEVRLTYHHTQEAWAQSNVAIAGRFASVPFDWTEALDCVTVGNTVAVDAERRLRDGLLRRRVPCVVARQPSAPERAP